MNNARNLIGHRLNIECGFLCAIWQELLVNKLIYFKGEKTRGGAVMKNDDKSILELVMWFLKADIMIESILMGLFFLVFMVLMLAQVFGGCSIF